MRRTIVALSVAAVGACAGGALPEESEWVPSASVGDDESTTAPPGAPLVDERPVERAEGVPPISGGTLLVLDDGNTVVAADPDRDLLHIATVDPAASIATIVLEHGDEPGRIAQDDDGLVHVVLRGAAAVLTIDSADWSVVGRQPSCPNPRGIAWDPERGNVLVACAGGELVFHTPAGGIERQVRVADDLRDVIVQAGQIRVSRFRSAELLDVDDDGAITQSVRPGVELTERVPAIAWRTVATAQGGWAMVHQSASTNRIDLSVPKYYDGGGGCFGPVGSILSLAAADGTLTHSPLLALATLPVDTAVSPDGKLIAIAIAGESDAFSPTITRTRGVIVLDAGVLAGPSSDCGDPEDIPIPGQPVAVAFTDSSTLVAQSREPAALFVIKNGGEMTQIALEGNARRDTGHDLFHQDAGTAVACASCHPEGGDDGRVWQFVALDELEEGGVLSRRSQSLRGGLAGTQPFHWSGDMASFAMLAAEIHVKRMGAAEQSPERLDAFEGWIFGIAASRPQRVDDAQVRSGQVTFVANCSICHGEDALAGNRTAEVDGEWFQVPSLRGVALRAPYMHDGRSPDLRSAVLDMARLTENRTITDAELDDLVAYLESL